MVFCLGFKIFNKAFVGLFLMFLFILLILFKIMIGFIFLVLISFWIMRLGIEFI